MIDLSRRRTLQGLGRGARRGGDDPAGGLALRPGAPVRRRRHPLGTGRAAVVHHRPGRTPTAGLADVSLTIFRLTVDTVLPYKCDRARVIFRPT